MPDFDLAIADETYKLLEVRPGQIRWETRQVPTQRGDGLRPVPHELRFEGGFGASKRYTDGQGRQTAPTHADYRQNWDSRFLGLNCAAPKISYLDLTSVAKSDGGFRLGGSAFGRLGGTFSGALGGGAFRDVPAAIEDFGNFLYVSAGPRTFVVDPEPTTPDVEEVREHGSGARVKSSDVFDNELVIACGASSDAEGATQPRTALPTQWETFADVRMSAYRTGKAARLFSARQNLVFNVLAGQDPATLANYLPSTGEVLTDATEPVRALEEYSRALVGSTAREVRTFDPDAGFFSRSLVPRGRVSPNEYDGFGMITLGDMLLVSFSRAVWLFRIGQKPELAGPELLDQNESPYIGGEPGVPDISGHGDFIYWPFYFPTSGDSVIFAVRPRKPGEPGIGPLVWQDLLWLEDRECRVVHYWGGTSTVKPRLFFGGGTTANPEILGWVPLGRTSPDIFNTDAVPAVTATLFAADDDFGLPATIKEVDRIEFPEITNADSSNYLVASVSADGGANYSDLLTVQEGGPDSPRIQDTGFQTVFAHVHDPIEAVKLKARLAITQAAAATTFLTIRGFPQLYVSERPLMTEQVTTLLDVQATSVQDAEDRAEQIKAHAAGQKVEIEGGTGGRTRWAKVADVQGVTVEIRGSNNQRDHRLAVQLVFREVAVQ